jgi:glycosyltransferase involved in cell wall biosynthesis
VVQIPHGVEVPDPSRLRLEERSEETFRAVYVGRIVQEHKRALLLPAILDASLRAGLDLRLTIAGEGPERRALEGAFRRLSLEDRIEWLGALRPEEAYAALLDAHALLLPSSSEGSPLTLLEAQACGCVPVASRLPGSTDHVVADGLTGILVDPQAGVETYASSLVALDRDRSRWRAMARSGHERVASSFRVESMGEAWWRLLQEGWSGTYPLPRPRRSGPPLDRCVMTWRDRLPEGARRGARRLRSALVASREGRT